MMSYGESRLFLASMLIVLCTLTLWVGRAFGAPATALWMLAAIFFVWIFWLAWTYDRGQRGSLRPPVRPRSAHNPDKPSGPPPTLMQ